jgi:hypothetical protein
MSDFCLPPRLPPVKKTSPVLVVKDLENLGMMKSILSSMVSNFGTVFYATSLT